ncbi:hypothetical protein P775_22665 [Puniceibacterium antarcticum]|uniref:DUF427 domain-containing protein n=1 Tax=Puniceibacterium antarcticum TaxID=1206336 RepID=A0A2G8R8J8_9RHOB|nr:DUF427 domain-containing protein [Puniceibacterium antarcticum]PIL17880.1 hypothetical protein P775_22665 [Puniceibacterium antarcticum]
MQKLPIENVQDYPRPPSLMDVPQRLRVMLAEHAAAETVKGLRVLETHHAPTYYFPRGDIRAELVAVGGGSFCEWKGHAQYFDVVMANKVATRAAWAYERPSSNFARIAGHVAFYAGLMDACFVGEERVIPQPGDFYGGWVTSNLRGTPKGSKGTLHW